MHSKQLEIINFIAQTIYDKKGSNVIAINVQDITPMTDFIVVAEGNIDRHIKAIADELIVKLKKKGHPPTHIEGGQSANWIVLDYTDFVIHLFTPDLREKYQLERLWSEGELVELNIQESKQA